MFPYPGWIGAFVIITYTALGGLWGSAVTNLIHCTVVILGLSVVGVMALDDLGGWAEVTRKVDLALASAAPPVDSASWWSFVGLGWWFRRRRQEGEEPDLVEAA